MTFSTYCRIERMAGGVAASDRSFIRAARTLLEPVAKTRAHRTVRQAWLREGIETLQRMRHLYEQMQ